MSPIQILLSVGLVGLLAYTAIQRVAPRVVKLSFYILALLGLYFVWVPDHTTAIANLLGVGRGTDLLIYLWIVLSLAIGLNLHLKVRAARRDITELARALALRTAADDPGEQGETYPGGGSASPIQGDD